MQTDQIKVWLGDFGQNYTNRNTFENQKAFEALYIERYGITRAEIIDLLLKDLDRDIRILEVGANIGNQLRALQGKGFKNLFGLELQRDAIEKAKQYCHSIDFIEGSALDIPFKDEYFDLVFTNNVLIHISPDNITQVMQEMTRVSRKYIWGTEYYAPEYTEIKYRGNSDLLWKCDFAKEFIDRCGNLEEVNSHLLECKDEAGLIDKTYLLQKA
ncbi:pseudaminic acid biosynthesis-associated methylase [Terasakiella sp. SH-1]|uniref:pseudaminic acid biosynthesis-associated methylase n=1 Tax=Terasakiella sp. SH-1 TaxID=2560057 RepID=UPI0010730859|nr:pseudaminic acid biosynthesis-associated methylase [Terasakiella sp. SH-1]